MKIIFKYFVSAYSYAHYTGSNNSTCLRIIFSERFFFFFFFFFNEYVATYCPQVRLVSKNIELVLKYSLSETYPIFRGWIPIWKNQNNISNTLPTPDKTGVKTITADKMIKIDRFTFTAWDIMKVEREI